MVERCDRTAEVRGSTPLFSISPKPLLITMKQKREQITCTGLPLAVYREIAAHLRQVKGINTGLTAQESLSTEPFNYNQSQVSSLWIEYGANFEPSFQPQVEAILDYYRGWRGDRSRQKACVARDTAK